jgi:hypothetical protein
MENIDFIKSAHDVLKVLMLQNPYVEMLKDQLHCLKSFFLNFAKM